jgi:hypothetical protein
MVLSPRQIHELVKSNRRYRNNATQLEKFDSLEGCQKLYWRKDRLFKKCCQENRIFTWIRLNLYPIHRKINSKCIRDLNPETLKLLEDNLKKTIEDISLGNTFLNRTTIHQEIGPIDKWDCIKLKTFWTAKKIITRMGENFYLLFMGQRIIFT